MIYKLSSQGESRIAIRFSEKESIETVMKWKNLVEWVWVDCFTMCPLTKDIENKLRDAGFKICLVSPELHGRFFEIDKMKGLKIDAVCTKKYNMWKWLKNI